MKTLLLTLTTCATLLVATAPAHAQFQRPEDAIKYRQSALSVMGTHFGRLGAMANGRIPFDPATATANAEIVATVARLPWSAFGPGTDSGNTKAKPDIWKEQGKFKELSDQAIAATDKLAAAAKTGNVDALKAAFGATAGSCKACHDAYRAQ